MLKTKSEILSLLKNNGIKRNSSNIFIARKDVDGYIVSFVVSFGSNDIIYVYDEKFGYVSFFA